MDLRRPFCSTDSQILGVSVGRFVLLTPRFWELLIGVNNYKGHPLNGRSFVACAFDFCARDKGTSVKRMAFIVVNTY